VNKEDRVMQTVLIPSTISDARNLVVALFMDIQDARGAIADLADAGFGKSQIRVIFSDQAKIVIRENPEIKAVDKQTTLDGGKSLVWRLRRSFNHDLHRSGTDQMTGQDQNQSSSSGAALYSKVSLREALSPLGVAEDTIGLLNREMGPDGLLILVDAGPRCPQTQSILERNAGIIRTDTATEHAHH
jgi:hypothetical protein